MSDIERLSAEVVVKFVLGLLEPLNIWVKAGQDRKDQKADLEAYREALAINPHIERFEGLATTIDSSLQDAGGEQRRQAYNVVRAAMKALSVMEQDNADLDGLNPEFRHRWTQEASNVSDEVLGDLWARLLAGELDSPGSVSNDTMSVARDMTKEMAEEFQKFCSMALYFVGSGDPILVITLGDLEWADLYRRHGMQHDIFTDLAYYSLIDPTPSMYSVPSELALRGFNVMWAGAPWTMKWLGDDHGWQDKDAPIRSIPGIRFTPAGRQLSRVVTRTHLTRDLRADVIERAKQIGWEMTSILWPSSEDSGDGVETGAAQST